MVWSRLALGLTLVLSGLTGCTASEPIPRQRVRAEGEPAVSTALPYDATNLVIYDNDSVLETYSDEFIMALASAGSITVSSSG